MLYCDTVSQHGLPECCVNNIGTVESTNISSRRS